MPLQSHVNKDVTAKIRHWIGDICEHIRSSGISFSKIDWSPLSGLDITVRLT